MATLLYHLTAKSANAKTGPIPVSTSSKALCPKSCPFADSGCYAASGPLALHWRAVTNGSRGMAWERFLGAVRDLPTATLWRHNQAGDIRDPDTEQGRIELWELVTANRGRRGFTYTHHRLTAAAGMAIKSATANGFTVNVSTETMAAADSAVARGFRSVTVVPSGDKRRIWRSPDGHPVVTCPAQVHEGMTCQKCRLCQARPQDVIIAFRAHGTGRKAVDATIAALGDEQA